MKKTLIFLITLSFIINMFSFSAMASDLPDSSLEVSFELLESLGIDNGINSDTSAPVTRAEFVAMAVRAVNMANAGSYDASFADVDENHPFVNEIYTAKNLKMTNGTAEGIFSPDDTVGYNVALKIMLVAMGYETMAVTYGGFPHGYAHIETKLGITKGISNKDALTVGDAKTIVTNALKEDMATFSAIEDGNVVFTSKKDVNLLTERFGLTKVSGTVTKAGYLSADENFSSDKSVIISGSRYKSEISSEKFFGTDVDAWVNKKENKIYAIEYTGISNTVVIDAKDLISHKSGVLSVFDGDKERKYKTAPGISFIENGRVVSHTDTDFVFPDGILKLIDTENDGKFDYAVAEKCEYFVITGINSANQTIYDKNSPLGYAELEPDSDKVRMIVDQNGKELDFDVFKNDMVVEVMQSRDKNVCVVRVSDSRKLDAVVTEVASESFFDGNTQYLASSLAVADGVEYVSNAYLKNARINLVPGESYTLYIAGDGTLTYAKRTGDGDIEYGFFLAFARKPGMEETSIIKILSQANNIETFELAEKITFDGEKGVLHTDSKLDTAFVNGKFYKYQLIRYSLDSDGKLVLIDTAKPGLKDDWERDENPDVQNMLTKYLDYATVNYRGGSYFGAPSFSFTKGVIFVAPTALHTTPDAHYPDEAFEIMDYSQLENNSNYTVDVYDFDEYYYPRAIVVYKDTTGGTVGSDTHLVYSVTDAATPDGDATKLIRTYSKGRYYRYFVASEELGRIALPNPGDVVRLAVDFNNQIKKVQVDVEYDITQNKATVLHTGQYTGFTSYISGKVKNLGSGSLVLRADSTPEPLQNTSNIAPLPLDYTSYAVFDVKKGTVTKATVNDVLTEELTGAEESDYVVCRLKYYAATDVIIYRK
ncbi:MAG: hypothetical protein J6B23_00610 [Clostridia bacterium]|nr:hypothetical protein [Clostridia bacterium]